MNAQDVLNVSLALSLEEFAKLFELLKKEVANKSSYDKSRNPPPITDEEVQLYLIKKTFQKKSPM